MTGSVTSDVVGRNVFGSADGDATRALGNALDEPAQYLAGSDFVKCRNALLRHEEDGFAPTHGAGDLIDQTARDLSWIGRWSGQHVGDKRHGWRPDRDFGEFIAHHI